MTIAEAPSLRKVNEATFNFGKIMASQIERYIKYYENDSERNESDFDDDGLSIKTVQSLSSEPQCETSVQIGLP